MDTVLLCGGCMEEDFVKQALEKIQPDCVIGIDKGLEFCYRNQIVPQYILGDFDSIDRQVLAYYENQEEIPVKRYQPEKDASDTRIGLELALKLQSTRIFLLGATGSLYGESSIPAGSLEIRSSGVDPGSAECSDRTGQGQEDPAAGAAWEICFLFLHGRSGGGDHAYRI